MKSKKTIEQYIKTYCIDQRIRSRNTLYVSSEIHEKIDKIVKLLRDAHVATASLVDTILKEHINIHRDMLKKEAGLQHLEFPEQSNSKDSIQDDDLSST